MNNKKGWMRILEATIAVLIVSGTLLVVYSRQVDRSVSATDYFEDLQGQILADVSTNSSLRLNVLNIDEDSSGDSNFSALNNFVAGKISEGFGYSLQVCNLSSFYDYCKMDYPTFVATIDKNIFTEEIIVSAELGDGSSATYEPKKVKLYVWEGDVEALGCVDDDGCYREGTESYCDTDLNAVVEITCTDSNDDGCLERGTDETEACETSEICENGECVDNKAELELEFSNVDLSTSGAYNIYTHTRTLEETNNIDFTVQTGQLCYLSTGLCDDELTINIALEGGTTHQFINKVFATPSTTDIEKFTLKWTIKDANDYVFIIENSMCIDEGIIEENC